VATFLADKRMLIVLDNAEHLTDVGAPIRDLAASAPLASILITSRIKLNLPGATHTRLEPMTVQPTAADGSTSPAVALLGDRVRSFDQSFELSPLNLPLLVEICERVDGLPLGLELVAPNVAGLGARETLDALSQRQRQSSDIAPDGDRHASLTATVAWSYSLLDAGTRDLFAQLSMFVGSFDVPAARAVSLQDPDEVDRGLVKLLSSSLLGSVEGVADERRFSMLVTVQDFARSLVTPADLPELEARHAAYFEQMAAVAARAVNGPDQGTWPTRMALELPNLRAALAWKERSDPDGLVEFATNLARYWDLAGMNTEGRPWLERALTEHQQPDAARARALRWLGRLSEHQGDLASANRTYRELSALQRKLGDWSGLADTQRGMAGVAAGRGRRREAQRLVEQALARHRQDGDLALSVDGLAQLTLMELEAGDSEQAMVHATEMERLSREIGNKGGIAVARHHLARGLRQGGRMREAQTAAKDALVLFAAADEVSWAPYSLLNLAWIELALGDLPEARRLLCQALARTQQMEEPGSLPRLLEAHAALAAVSGDDDLAEQITKAADAIRDRNHWPRNRSDSRELRRYVKAKRTPSSTTDPTPSDVDQLVHTLLEDCQH
jgi:non-specific serine/threonine protein kinase